MNSGSTPDQTTLEQLKSELADGLKADTAASEREKDRIDQAAIRGRKGRRRADGGQSGSGSDDGGRKRSRLANNDTDDIDDDCAP